VKATNAIGVCVDNETGVGTETSRATIHYSKTGTHVVPTQEIGGAE
ncbi:MAG: polymorphic toxin type 50 domain-containing protein, partial [Clostridia bacterium]